MLPNSLMKADKKIRCGNLLLYPIVRLLALPLERIKQ